MELMETGAGTIAVIIILTVAVTFGITVAITRWIFKVNVIEKHLEDINRKMDDLPKTPAF